MWPLIAHIELSCTVIVLHKYVNVLLVALKDKLKAKWECNDLSFRQYV